MAKSKLDQRTCLHAVEILLGRPLTCRSDKEAEKARKLVEQIIDARAASQDLSLKEILAMLKETCLLSIDAAKEDDKAIPVALRSLKILKELERENILSEERINATIQILKTITPHDLMGLFYTSKDFDTFKEHLIRYETEELL